MTESLVVRLVTLVVVGCVAMAAIWLTDRAAVRPVLKTQVVANSAPFTQFLAGLTVAGFYVLAILAGGTLAGLVVVTY